ncbi:MAG: hypothetical protein JO269_13165 [Burkholderiaceae bacterium]|nr:hypothetical protein [Burkholderiaceae bacterium]
MELRQLNATYVPEEDRILLRASFGADDDLQEIRAWLTRRLVKTLWPGMMQALETQVALDRPQVAHASTEIVSMEHEATVTDLRTRGKFDQPFSAENHRLPLGEQPIVLITTQIALEPQQAPRLQFTSARNGSFEFALNPAMLHGLCILLQESVAQADWDMALRLPGDAAILWDEDPELAGSPQRLLN